MARSLDEVEILRFFFNDTDGPGYSYSNWSSQMSKRSGDKCRVVPVSHMKNRRTRYRSKPNVHLLVEPAIIRDEFFKWDILGNFQILCLPLKDLRNRLYKNLYHLHDTLRKPFLAKFLPTMKRRDRLREYKAHLCVKQNPTWMPASLCHRSHLSLVITGTLTTCNTLGRLTSGTKMLISGPVTSSGISAPQPAT